MELVYLWVEEYKNIKKQGFNFSPRFECNFNDELKSNYKLDAIDREVTEEIYIKDFFGKNINICTIVGKNGSGKSNILELLANAITDKLVIKVFFDGENLIYTTNKKIEIETNLKRKKIEEHMIFYTEIPSYNSLKNNNMTNISFWNMVQNEHGSLSENISIVKNKIQTNQMILIKKYNFLASLNKEPKFIEFSFNHHLFDNIEYNDYNSIYKALFMIFLERESMEGISINQFDDLESYFFFNDTTFNIREFKDYIEESITDEETLIWIENKNEYVILFIDEYIKLIKSKPTIKDIKKEIPKILDENYEEYYEEENNYIETFKILIEFNQFTPEFLETITNLFSYTREELIINLKWDISLSTGEESFLNLFASLYYCIKKHSYSLQHINIIIDEIEAYLHPNWQKKFIKELIKFFNFEEIKYKSKTNIILTTHSPFLVSDMPKKSVLFLDDGERSFPFIKKGTLGANIHTLLSHGFFMEDGLMGEFAKDKISQIMFLLNGEIGPINIPFEQIKPIIEMIGEDFLREKLLLMYDKKFPKSKEYRIKELEAEIERLKNDTNIS